MTFRDDELTTYLYEVDIPVLTDMYRTRLDRPITLEETLKALKSMQPGKTPGPDGKAVELYKQYPDILANRLHKMLTAAEDLQSRPHSMREAVIIVNQEKILLCAPPIDQFCC